MPGFPVSSPEEVVNKCLQTSDRSSLRKLLVPQDFECSQTHSEEPSPVASSHPFLEEISISHPSESPVFPSLTNPFSEDFHTQVFSCVPFRENNENSVSPNPFLFPGREHVVQLAKAELQCLATSFANNPLAMNSVTQFSILDVYSLFASVLKDSTP